jgi:hypothetical protein
MNYKDIELDQFLSGMTYNTSKLKIRLGGQGPPKKKCPEINMDDVLTQPLPPHSDLSSSSQPVRSTRKIKLIELILQ